MAGPERRGGSCVRVWHGLVARINGRRRGPARDQPRADGLTRRTAMPTNKKPHFKKKKKAVEDNDDAEIIDEGEYEGEGE